VLFKSGFPFPDIIETANVLFFVVRADLWSDPQHKPREALRKSQLAFATTIGLGGKAMATDVPSSTRSVFTGR
jgi:hypothetical protein